MINKISARYPELSIEIYKNQNNLGIGETRNKLLSYVKGEYFIFCDADDFIKPEMYKELYEKAIQTNADLICCNAFVYNSDENIQETDLLLPKDNIKAVEGFLNDSIGTYLWTKLFKSKFIKDNDIKFETGINIQEDLLFCFRVIVRDAVIENLTLPLYFYYRAENCSITSKITKKHIQQMQNVCRLIESELKLYTRYNTNQVRNNLRRKENQLILSYVKRLVLFQK